MQGRVHVRNEKLLAAVFLAIIALPATTRSADLASIGVTVGGDLTDPPADLSRMLDAILRTRPMTLRQRARLLGKAAPCKPHVQTSSEEPEEVETGEQSALGTSQTQSPRGAAPQTQPSRAASAADPPPPRTPDGCDAHDARAGGSPYDRGQPAPGPRDLRRWIRTLLSEQLGYCVRAVVVKGDRIDVQLRRYRVVRKVKIRGNWPIFEEEFLRRLSLRAGQRVPEGPELTQTLANQQERLKRFLARRGYFEGTLTIRLTPGPDENQVNVHVRVRKGTSYKVGDIDIEQMGHRRRRGKRDASAGWEPAVPRHEIEALFRDYILFYQRGFNTARCKKHVLELAERYHRLGYPGVRIKDDCTKLPKQITERGVRITLSIQERKHITVQYRGNDHISDQELNESLTLAEAGAYDSYELAQSAEQLHRKYQSEGFLQARIRFSRQTQPTRDIVTFHVHEGPRFRVERVDFRGNRAIDEEELAATVRTKTYPFLGLGEGGYVTNVQLVQDQRRLIELYRSRGFTRVAVDAALAPHPELLDRPGALAAATAAPGASDRKLYVRFTIDEGPRTRVERIEVVGAHLHDEQQLLAQMQLRSGGAFSQRMLQRDRTQIKRLYFEREGVRTRA